MRDLVTDMAQRAGLRISNGFGWDDTTLQLDRRYQKSPSLYRVMERGTRREIYGRVSQRPQGAALLEQEAGIGDDPATLARAQRVLAVSLREWREAQGHNYNYKGWQP